MKKFLLEACADSVESVLAAQAGGADRIELCGNIIIGGTTPSPCLLKEIRKHSGIRIHVLIRPRFGDFCYTEYECAMIEEEIRMFRALGAEGVVIGVLTPDGTLNLPVMERLMEAAAGMSVTLHRAFDVCRDPFETLEQAAALGIHTILTSGQRNTCLDGAALIGQLQARADGRIRIMAGAGVSASVIPALYQKGIREFHMTGKQVLDSPMRYRKEGVSMGLPSLSEYEIFRTDEAKIREARVLLEQLTKEEAGCF